MTPTRQKLKVTSSIYVICAKHMLYICLLYESTTSKHTTLLSMMSRNSINITYFLMPDVVLV